MTFFSRLPSTNWRERRRLDDLDHGERGVLHLIKSTKTRSPPLLGRSNSRTWTLVIKGARWDRKLLRRQQVQWQARRPSSQTSNWPALLTRRRNPTHSLSMRATTDGLLMSVDDTIALRRLQEELAFSRTSTSPTPYRNSPLGLLEETGFFASVGKSERKARIHIGARSNAWS